MACKSTQTKSGSGGVDYALNLCLGCRRRRFLAVGDKPCDHAHDKLSCFAALDTEIKGSPLNMVLTIKRVSLPFKEGQARSFFSKISNLLYNGQAINEPGGQR
jgi:hypothetical protein